jgi:hypothetical protein
MSLMIIGESLVGTGANVAHVNTVLGPRERPGRRRVGHGTGHSPGRVRPRRHRRHPSCAAPHT